MIVWQHEKLPTLSNLQKRHKSFYYIAVIALSSDRKV